MQFHPPTGLRRAAHDGFTLIELLVVITIIALIATIGLPALKGFGKSNAIVATDRQLLDDIAAARQRAIAEHTTVYVLFASPALASPATNKDAMELKYSDLQKTQLSNIARGQFTSYAFYSERSVGDQPGQKTKRYLSKWKTIPDGLMIAPAKYDYNRVTNSDGVWSFEVGEFPYPAGTNQTVTHIPFLAFNHLGQLVHTNGDLSARNDGGEILPLARGSIFYADPQNPLRADVLETPPGNSQKLINGKTNTTWHYIRIDALTGRAHVEQYEIPALP